jgi:hypothetical protein
MAMTIKFFKKEAFEEGEEINYYKLLKHYKHLEWDSMRLSRACRGGAIVGMMAGDRYYVANSTLPLLHHVQAPAQNIIIAIVQE